MVAQQLTKPEQEHACQQDRGRGQNRGRRLGHIGIGQKHAAQRLQPDQKAQHPGLEPALGAAIIGQTQKAARIRQLRKDLLAQPARREKAEPRRDQGLRHHIAQRPQHSRKAQGGGHGPNAQHRHDDLPQRGQKGPDLLPPDRGFSLNFKNDPFDQRPPAQDHGQGKEDQTQNDGQTVQQIAPLGLIAPIIAHFFGQIGEHLGHDRSGRGPVRRIDGGWRQTQEFIRLTLAQDAVDFADQPIGKAVSLDRRNRRSLQQRQLFVQLLAAGGEFGGFRLSFGGGRAQSLDLRAQRVDPGGIGALRIQKALTPTGDLAAQLFKLDRRGLRIADLILGGLCCCVPSRIIQRPGCAGGQRGCHLAREIRAALCQNGSRKPEDKGCQDHPNSDKCHCGHPFPARNPRRQLIFKNRRQGQRGCVQPARHRQVF